MEKNELTLNYNFSENENIVLKMDVVLQLFLGNVLAKRPIYNCFKDTSLCDSLPLIPSQKCVNPNYDQNGTKVTGFIYRANLFHCQLSYD